MKITILAPEESFLSVDVRANLIAEILAFDDESLAYALELAKKERHRMNQSRRRTIKIKEGLSLYFNSHSPFYWCRVGGLPGGGDRRESTKQTDVELAKQEARAIEARVRSQAESGTLVQTTKDSWTKVCKLVIKSLRAEATKLKAEGEIKPQQHVHAGIIESHLMPAFSQFKINHIGYPELCEYVDALGDVSKTVANNQKKALKIVFEYALRNRMITVDRVPQIPPFNIATSQAEARPFEEADREALISPNSLQKFIGASRKGVTRNLRTQFPMYLNFLCATGVRTGEEPLNMRWTDIRAQVVEQSGIDVTMFWAIIRKGKTKKAVIENKEKKHISRTIILNHNAVKTLEQLYYVSYGDKLSIQDIIGLEIDALVFSPPGVRGKPDFADVFEQYQEFISKDLRNRYTLYSCRHEYINMQLDQRASAADVAEQCGNSTATIEKYYKKYQSTNRIARLLTPDDIQAFNPAL